MTLTRRQLAAATLLAPSLVAARSNPAVTRQAWDRLADGRDVHLYTLTNRNGLTAQVSDLGGVLYALRTPDRTGRLGDVVLGYPKAQDYVADRSMFGAVIGRYANRIGHARFSLDGRRYALAANVPGGHNLHAGPDGWYKRLWQARPIDDPAGATLELSLLSPDGDQGFPGAVSVTFTYRLTDDNRLQMKARATTDAPTVVSMTSHGYFNLSADPSRPVLDTVLEIDAGAYTPGDASRLPTGEIRPVEGTPYDFRRPRSIGRDMPPGGYDDNLVLDGVAGQVRRAARAYDPWSGRTLELWTDQPGVQLYTAGSLHAVGKGGAAYGPAAGFCLEAQHFPDSPNIPQFPSTTLRPGQHFAWFAEYRFGAQATGYTFT